MLSGIRIELETDRADGIGVATVSGELGLHTAGRFTEVLSRAATPAAPSRVLDLSALSFLDSSGLAAILSLLRSTEAAGGRLAVVSSRASVNRAFELTRLNEVLGVVATRDEAFALVDGPGD